MGYRENYVYNNEYLEVHTCTNLKLCPQVDRLIKSVLIKGGVLIPGIIL